MQGTENLDAKVIHYVETHSDENALCGAKANIGGSFWYRLKENIDRPYTYGQRPCPKCADEVQKESKS